VALRAKNDESAFFTKLDSLLELVARAHQEKKKFIEELLALEGRGPLSLLAMKRDGNPYLRMWRVSYLVGIIGLNEVVQILKGKELHENRDMLKLGLKIISHMKLKCEELSKNYGMHFVLEQTPAESTAYRFAKLDLKHFGDAASRVVKGNQATGEVYYTNSTYFNVSHPMNPIDKVVEEGLFHPLIDAGALTHVWLGESQPSPASIANFVVKTFKNSQNSQIAFSPEFTSCNDCGKIARGLRDTCSYCNSTNVEGITRITGYFSKISGWNKGKLGELKDRYRVRLETA
jgi:ribonucleoside-triphosphate reductase